MHVIVFEQERSYAQDSHHHRVTVDDLGRGLKSAAQNVEKEIPKMGSAIGSAFKKITEKRPEKPSAKEPAKQNK